MKADVKIKGNYTKVAFAKAARSLEKAASAERLENPLYVVKIQYYDLQGRFQIIMTNSFMNYEDTEFACKVLSKVVRETPFFNTQAISCTVVFDNCEPEYIDMVALLRNVEQALSGYASENMQEREQCHIELRTMI